MDCLCAALGSCRLGNGPQRYGFLSFLSISKGRRRGGVERHRREETPVLDAFTSVAPCRYVWILAGVEMTRESEGERLRVTATSGGLGAYSNSLAVNRHVHLLLSLPRQESMYRCLPGCTTCIAMIATYIPTLTLVENLSAVWCPGIGRGD